MRPDSSSQRSRRRAIPVAVAVAGLAAAPLVAAHSPAEAAPTGPAARYIVQVTGAPVASYTGGVPGIAPTKPAKGRKVDRRSGSARSYAGYLRKVQTDVLTSAGAPTSSVKRSYSTAFNGFAATLTPSQVADLRKSPKVVRVWKDEVRKSDTTTTPKFLGLSGTGGVWEKQFGSPANAGQGMIIGVIDSGIWPESGSFAATPQTPAQAAAIQAKWKGVCDTGTDTKGPAFACNNKLIGARYYKENATVIPQEYLSPRDFGGHGTHTASTSGGNNDVPASINGAPVGKASGMAPGARIAAYKALWERADMSGSSGSTSDLVAAIDDAVGDGVDVINYSISGSREYVVSPDELAFLGAADAGVFVSTSAGNEGDSIGVSSVAHNSPWTMTVAASTHDRPSSKTVTLGNGQTYEGVGVGAGVGPKPVVTSASVAAAGAPAGAADLCYSDADQNAANGVQPALDPAKAAGKIVVCKRGTNARTDKSAAVKAAGGVGMILVNTAAGQSLDADFHPVPSIHVDNVAGTSVLAYAGTAGATATVSAVSTTPARAPEMAGFSSYGPATAGGGDLLKPDITAPGSGVIAAVAPPGNNGNSFDAYSGTSMSAPHVAGLGALVKQAHPTWSPAAVKSALMTTATILDNQGKPIQRAGKNATPLDYGAGHVRPAQSFNPGLVYDAGADDWLKYACGIGQLQLVSDPEACDTIGSIDPSNLNYPSISVGDLAGKQVITRTVTNVSGQTGVYRTQVKAPAGFSATVSPAVIAVPKGQSRSYTVTLTRTSAAYGSWAFGSVTLSGLGTTRTAVTSPVAVRAVAAAAPAESVQSSASGSQTFDVRSGFAGTLTATGAGLVPSTVQTSPTKAGTPTQVQVQVPAGTKVARFATYDADVPTGVDIDISVSKDGKEVGSSGGGTAEEAVTLKDPAAGTYTVTLDLFAGASALDIKAHSFVVPGTASANLTVTPPSQRVTTGATAKVTAAWTGLTPGQHYLGAAIYGSGTTEVGRTLLTVNP